ncbi:MAG: hypothetical protein EOM26_00445 [Alphaproteobacteria bacterium]|nr:hypothetical protein [Alphaproteobacteria bacterium]
MLAARAFVYVSLFFSFFVFAASSVSAQDLERLADPIFVKTPSVSDSVNAQESFTLYVSYDYERCRAHYGRKYHAGCQRRLELDGTRAETGADINPPVKGEWRWQGDYALQFTPGEVWRAGTRYEIELDLDALGVPESVRMDDGARRATVGFTTEPLTVTFPEMRYMQDPTDPGRKLITAKLRANYPLEPGGLEKKLRLQLEKTSGDRLESAETMPEAEVIADTDGMGARVNVSLDGLPEAERFLRLIVEAGLVPEHGGEASSQPFSERTRIPTLSSYLAIEQPAAAIVRAQDGTPGQILSFSTNVQARPADIREHITLYLLPERHPAAGNEKSGEPYRWKADNEVTPAILGLSEPLTLNPAIDGNEYTTRFGFPFTAPEGRYLFVSAAPELGAFGGYTLGREFRTILQVPEWPHDLDIRQAGSIMSLSGSKKLSLHARGTDRLEVEVAHILPQALQHFISQTSGDIESPSFTNWRFGAQDIAEIDTASIPMAYEGPSASQFAAFDFAPYLKDDRKGLFLLTIRGYRDGKTAGATRQRFVLVSDMGLIVKESGNGTRDAYLASFTTGKPVKGAELSVLGRNGVPVFSGRTSADGHISVPAFEGAAEDREPVAIVAKMNGDFTFIPWSRDDRLLNFSKFDTGGAVTMTEGLNALLFSDRGIYRPGETLRVGAIVRNADWTALPEGLPLQFAIVDPRGRTVLDRVLRFPPEGLQELSLDTAENWPTGAYRATLSISRDGKSGSLLGSTVLRVEEFQPDRLRIETAFSHAPSGWLNPEGLSANVTLTNLYGTPATDRRVEAAITLNPALLRFDGFPDYRFYDPYPARARSVQLDLPATETNGEGKAAIPLRLSGQDPATYSLHLETRGFEAGSGRGVTSYSTALVSPMPWAVGYRTNARLSWLATDKNYELHLIAVGPDLQQVAAENLTLQRVRRTSVSSLIRRDDGSYAYESVPKEEIVSELPFLIAESGSDLAIQTTKPGRFSVRLVDGDGRVVADIPYAVAGEGQRTADLDKETVLDLRIDKQSYKAGEEIRIGISAPYGGAGLITLESDRVLAHKWFRSEKTDTVQTIPVPDEFSGKGYVNVAFVRDINSPEIYLSPLSYAAVPFTANTQAGTLEIDLSVPETARPGEPVTVTYSGSGKGKALVYAVDEGILQVADYRTPDPVEFFLLDRALQVRTSQMLDLLMPEFDLVRKLSADGGGAAAEATTLGKHLNPFKRKTLAPAIYWSGIVDIGEEERSLTFTPPGHFNGTMRVMAVGVSDDGVGSAERDIVLQGELIVTPNAPLFLAPGDEASVSVTLANNVEGSGEGAGLSLGMEGEGLEIGQMPERIDVPEGTEETFTFPVTAKAEPGPTALNVKAALNDRTQEAAATLSIRPPVPLETTMRSGYAKDGSGTIAFERALYDHGARRSVALSPLPSAYIYGLLRYLESYPYGCTEQLVSRAMPQLALESAPEFGVREEDMEKRLSEAVSALRRRQTDEGGFAMWDGGREPHDFLTVYALDFLVQAREAGHPVPSEPVEQGLRYLRNWTNRDIRSMDDARIKAYGIYVLTRSGIVTTNEILHLLKYFEKQTAWKTDLSAVYIAAAYRMMRQDALAEKTLGAFESGLSAQRIGYSEGSWNAPWYNPFIELARYVSLLARHFPERFESMDPDLVFRLAAFVNEGRYSTISSSYAIMALQDFAARERDRLTGESIELFADGQPLGLPENALSVEVSTDTHELTFRGAGRPVFFTVTETGFDRTLPEEPVADKMEIARAYRMPDGTPVGKSVATGDVIEAVITIRSHGSRSVENVAIVDLLPGGFELELEGAGKNSTFWTDFVDKREDRVIAFGTVTPVERTFRYRIRAVSEGRFIVPPPFAEAMYDPTTKARGLPGAITIANAP